MAKKLTEDQIKWILSLDVSQAEEGYHKLSQENKKLEERNKEVKKSLRDLEKAGKTESDAFKNLSKELVANNQRLASNREMVKLLSLQMGLTNMTMTQLKRHAQDLQRQLDNTSESLHPEEYAKLNRQLLATKERMNELKGTGKNIEAEFGKVIKSQGTIAAFLGNIYTKAVEWGIQLLAKGKEFIAESIKMAASADGVQRAFDALDQPGLLKNLQEATKGTVNNLELMKAAVRAKDFRIPLEDLGKYLQFARLKAQQTGQSVEYMTDSIVTGLGRKSLLILDNLGLSAAEINEEVAKTGDFIKGVASIVDKQLTAAGEKYVSAADRIQQKNVLIQNIQLSIGQRMQSLADGWEGAWTRLLKVVNKFVSIPVEDKIRLERQEVNQLATAIMSANDRTDIRRRLIRELNQKYPKFLENLDVEKLTNEQLGNRLREVNQEYSNKIRIQVMNDKVLAPMQKKERKLTEEQIDLYKGMAWTVQNLGQYMSRSLVDAIKNGTVINMTTQEINAELQKMEKNGAGKSLTRYSSGLEGKINRLKEIPDELKKVRSEAEKTMSIINGMQDNKKQEDSGTLEPAPKKDLIEEKKKEIEIAEASIATTEEEVIAKNKKVKALKEELEALQSLGVEKSKDKSDPNAIALKNMESAHAAEINEIRLSGQEKQQAEEDINLAILQSDQAYYTGRISQLEKFKANEKKASKQADYQKQIVDSKTKLIETEVSMEKQRIAAIEKLRQEDLTKEEAVTKAQQIYYTNELTEKKITQEQHEMLMLSLASSSSEMRYAIEERYLNDINDLELKNGKLKADVVKQANDAVLTAEQNAANARAALQAKMNNLVKDFKNQFKVTTVDEDLEMQQQVLKAAYQARLEMARKNHMDTLELEKAYNRASLQLVRDKEKKRNEILDKYGLRSSKDELDEELDQLKEALEEGVITYDEFLKSRDLAYLNYWKKQFDYYSGLFSGAINALQEAEMSNVDAKYDAEIEAAQGNAEEVERLEKEKAQKKLDIEKKYADINFAIKSSQIIADTAVSIMKALATLGPIAGPIAAALMGITGAAQLAAANAERKKVKNMTLSGTGSSSKMTRVAVGRESGGKIDITRAQDGKYFPGADYNPDKRGFVDKPTVIVGEGPAGKSKEWIAGNDAVTNPTIAPFLNILDRAQQAGTIRTLDLNKVIQARMAGFAAGGSISPRPANDPPQSPPVNDNNMNDALLRFCNIMDRLEEEGLPAYTLLDEYDKARKLQQRSRKIGSKS